ncbi:MAG: lysylphosphatidylglycerol synthase transmembrane domain-containing protein [Candidatus Aenigmatarchaeota archaeon]
MKREIWEFLVLLCVGLVAIFVLFNIIGFDRIVNELLQLNLYYYAAVIALIIGGSILWAMRWGVFLRDSKPTISKIELIKMMLVGQAVNNLTPVVKMGGEAARVYLLKKRHKVEPKEGFASVASDLTLEFIVDIMTVTTAVILLLVFTSPPLLVYIMILIFTLVSALIVFVILEIYFGYSKLFRFILWLSQYIKGLKDRKEEIVDKYKTFRKNFRKSLNNRKMFSEALILSLGRKGLTVMKFYILLAALGHHLSLVSILIAIGLSIMLLLIPGVPGNLGVYEGGMASVFIFLGVSPGIAATAVFLDRLVWYWGITAVGGMLGSKYGLDLIVKRKNGGY